MAGDVNLFVDDSQRDVAEIEIMIAGIDFFGDPGAVHRAWQLKLQIGQIGTI